MRTTLPAAFAKINAELAVGLAESGEVELALLHIQFMREISAGPAQAEKTVELVLTPARKRLDEQIRQAKNRADKNPRDAITAARELFKDARKTLALFDLFFDEDTNLRNDVFDEVVGICNQLQVAYHKATDDNDACLEFLRVVLPFATSTDLREQIEKNTATLKRIAATRSQRRCMPCSNLRP